MVQLQCTYKHQTIPRAISPVSLPKEAPTARPPHHGQLLHVVDAGCSILKASRMAGQAACRNARGRPHHLGRARQTARRYVWATVAFWKPLAWQGKQLVEKRVVGHGISEGQGRQLVEMRVVGHSISEGQGIQLGDVRGRL